MVASCSQAPFSFLLHTESNGKLDGAWVHNLQLPSCQLDDLKAIPGYATAGSKSYPMVEMDYLAGITE